MPNVISFMSYVLIVTFTPGPNNIMSFVMGSKHGFARTLPFRLGVAVGFGLVMIASSYLNLFLFSVVPKMRPVAEIVGGAYMLYLAARVLMSKVDAPNEDAHLTSFPAGAALQFINPKAILYGLTVTATFITPYYHSAASLLFFSAFAADPSLLLNVRWAMFARPYSGARSTEKIPSTSHGHLCMRGLGVGVSLAYRRLLRCPARGSLIVASGR